MLLKITFLQWTITDGGLNIFLIFWKISVIWRSFDASQSWQWDNKKCNIADLVSGHLLRYDIANTCAFLFTTKNKSADHNFLFVHRIQDPWYIKSLCVDILVCGYYCVWIFLCVDVILCGYSCVNILVCGYSCVWIFFCVESTLWIFLCAQDDVLFVDWGKRRRFRPWENLRKQRLRNTT